MDEELDINKIVAEIASDKIAAFFEAGKTFYGKLKNSVELKLKSNYESYLINIYKRLSLTKNFFYRNRPENFYSFYVPIDLQGGSIIENPKFHYLRSSNRRILITGSAGSGKSTLIRHLALDCLINDKRLPIFLELRNLNDNKLSITEFAKHYLMTHGFEVDDDYFTKALKADHFVIFLDGLDEVAHHLRFSICNEIHSLSLTFNNTIVITSRPNIYSQAFDDFIEFRTKGLSMKKASLLITKLPIDDDIKSRFISELENNLYESHQELLANPLFLIVVLLMYANNAAIPNRFTLFFEQAYQCLFQTHDAISKAGYRREHLCKLYSCRWVE